MKALLALAALVTAFALSRNSLAAEETNEALFQGAVAALGSGAVDDAIDRFELLADRGFAHPDASYDRAIAYVQRASTHGAHPGDLGRAAAALSESLALRDGDDADAKLALDRVRQEIARKRSHAGSKEVEQKPSLGWAVVGLLGEDVWAMLAIFGSAVATVGLALRFVAGKDAVRLAGVVAASLGIAVATVTGSLAYLARYERLHFRQAVVVVDEAHLLDENGANISGPGSVVPEGAAVRVTGERGTLAHVEWGTLDGWLSFGQLRLLARREVP
jgi:hypothetical protein